MSDPRLPAHLEVAGLIRATEAAGGFATVIQKGERDAGVILLLTTEKGGNARLWERLPRLDGRRLFTMVKAEDVDNLKEFSEYVDRRRSRDRDAWVIELAIADAERLVAELGR